MTRTSKQSTLHHAGPRRRLQPNDKRSTRTPNRASATLVRKLSHAKATGRRDQENRTACPVRASSILARGVVQVLFARLGVDAEQVVDQPHDPPRARSPYDACHLRACGPCSARSGGQHG
jgi:hypothetical protein